MWRCPDRLPCGAGRREPTTPSSCCADSCARVQSPLASHHSPARACVSPAGGSVAVSDWRNSSKVMELSSRNMRTQTMMCGRVSTAHQEGVELQALGQATAETQKLNSFRASDRLVRFPARARRTRTHVLASAAPAPQTVEGLRYLTQIHAAPTTASC